MTDLLADTLERSPEIERADVEAAMADASGVGRMLVAGGHLEKNALVTVAGELWLEITTVSGGGALTLEENLNPVPGGTTASDWTIFLPGCEPLAKLVRETARGHEHLSADEPKAVASASAQVATSALDEKALARWAQGER